MMADAGFILQVLQTIMLAGGGVAALIVMRNTVAGMKIDFASAKSSTEKSFDNVNVELKKLVEVVAVMAVMDERVKNLDRRVTAHDETIEELRRGTGYVTGPRRHSVDGEYGS